MIYVAFAVALVASGPAYLGEYSIDILIRSFLFAVAIVGLDVVWGYTGMLSFGQSAFFAIGAYACGLTFVHMGFSPGSALFAALGGCVVAATVAAGIGWLAFAYGVSGLYISVATLVLSVVFVRIILAGGAFTGSSSGLAGFPTFRFTMSDWFWITGFSLIVVTTLARKFVRSDAGTLCIAVRENETRCRYFGIQTGFIKTSVLVGSAVLAALAGFAYAGYSDVVGPSLGGFRLGTEMVIWVALGGRGRLIGPVVAAVLINFIGAYLSGSLPFIWELLVGVAFVVVIVLVPEGIGPALGALFLRVSAFARRDVTRAIAGPGKGAITGEIGASPDERHDRFSGDFVLELTDVSRHYGSLTVLSGVSLNVESGELVSLVGPNGAGKTTLIKCISDGAERSRGTIRICGVEIGRRWPERCAQLGLGRKFQTPTVFDALSVFESLRVARSRRESPSLWRRDADVHLPGAARRVVEAAGLDRMLGEQVRHLSHGGKQALELAMVLATEPKVLLLDEPTAGLTKNERTEVGAILVEIAEKRGLSIVLVEHDFDFVREISSRIVVLHQGKIALDGGVAEVVNSALVQEIYVGQPNAHEAS